MNPLLLHPEREEGVMAERGCIACRRKRVLLVYRVRAPFILPVWNPETRQREDRPAAVGERTHARCVDREDCKRYRDEQATKAARRTKVIVLVEPAMPHAPPGTCRWCGGRISITDDAHPMTRRRNYHRGDKWEIGDRDCKREYLRSRCFSARDVVERRGDRECVDCGETEGYWEADHDDPLWNGGEHTAENIVRRCGPCHTEKTRREAAERAALQRGDVPTDQLALATPQPPDTKEGGE